MQTAHEYLESESMSSVRQDQVMNAESRDRLNVLLTEHGCRRVDRRVRNDDLFVTIILHEFCIFQIVLGFCYWGLKLWGRMPTVRTVRRMI